MYDYWFLYAFTTRKEGTVFWGTAIEKLPCKLPLSPSKLTSPMSLP